MNNQNLLKGAGNIFLVFLILFFSSFIVSAGFGLDNENLPRVTRDAPAVITFNNNTGAVNSSDYWDNLDTPSDISIFLLNTGDTGIGDYNFTNVNITESLFVNPTGDKYSRFGSVPSVFSPSDATDTLVSVSSVSTNINIRGFAGIGEYTGAVTKTTSGYGVNTFFYHDGDGDNTNNAGEGGNRAVWFGSCANCEVERAGGVSATAFIQNTADTMTVSEAAYAFRAEGNAVKNADSIITNSYNFFGEVFGTATGTVTNNMGFIQQELTDGTNNIEIGIGGGGIIGFGLEFTGDVYDGGMPTEFIMREIEDEGGPGEIKILNLNGLDFIDFTINGTKTTSFSVNTMGPVNNDEIDLSNPTNRWRNLFLSGYADILGDLNASGNITSENVFIPQYAFSHTNETITLDGASVWTNITFTQESTDILYGIKHNHVGNGSSVFNISMSGIYEVAYDLDVEDTSVSASDIDVAGRLVYFNGTEFEGSEYETDIVKNGAEVELSHDFLVRLIAGDRILFQFIAEDEDVVISTHGTFGDYPESVGVVIKKIANLPT